MAIDRTVPSERNNTYDPSDVSRKTNEDLFETAFNSDQKTALLSKFSEGGSGDGVSPLIVNVNRFDNPITADKTFAELLEAYNGCRPIYINLRPVIGFMVTEDSEGNIISLDLTTLDANSFDPLYFGTYTVDKNEEWSFVERSVDAQ